LPCTDDHHIDNDPCPHCGSTRTDAATEDQWSPITVCTDCGEVFDVSEEGLDPTE
jgi:transcription initiation factor TFIIIB Brf1 subunit/transcription initiation factor TFIIB